MTLSRIIEVCLSPLWLLISTNLAVDWQNFSSNTGEGEILEKDARYIYTSLFLLIFLSTKRSEICLRVIFYLKVMKFKSTEIFSVYPCKVF